MAAGITNLTTNLVQISLLPFKLLPITTHTQTWTCRSFFWTGALDLSSLAGFIMIHQGLIPARGRAESNFSSQLEKSTHLTNVMSHKFRCCRRESGKTTTGDIPGNPGITRPGVYPGITRYNPKQETCYGISQYKNLVLGYLGISWDISWGDNSVQDRIWRDIPAPVRRVTWDRPGYPSLNEFWKGWPRLCSLLNLSLIHIWRCRRSTLCRSRWSPYH